jgi:hypothetical protein
MRQPGANHHNPRGSFRSGLFLDYDLHITVKGIQKVHEPLKGEPLYNDNSPKQKSSAD